MTSGNLQAYSLTCLKNCLTFVAGMESVSTSPTVVGELYNLTDPDSSEKRQATIYKNALEILIVLCNYLENGFALVHSAAKKLARQKNSANKGGALEKPYKNFVGLLKCGDMDVMINTLTLMNLMLSKAPSDLSGKKLLFRWKTLGINEILEVFSDGQPKSAQKKISIQFPLPSPSFSSDINYYFRQ